ncbi:MAG: tetratricopeptide repeat protein [Helicobacteraceae bacterium]|jgi:Ca-activated chloride channel family protein|nr:tetratricopeptide repeat protein [Helicobacteraceae bacterium]
MFRSAALTLLMGMTLFGGLLDFRTLEKAKEAYANEHYSEAAALYESIEDKNDDLHYNLGDAYYKEKKYDEALKQYEQVNKSELRAKALHNMGNAYANTQKSDEAIATYEEALKLGDDEDTKFNLELLKKQKEEQEKQDQNQDDQDKKNDQKKDDKNKQENQQENKEDQKKDQSSDKESEQEQQDKAGDSKKDQEKKEQEEKEKQAKEEQEKKEDKSDKEQGKMNQGEVKEDPISDMQERKYEKMLDKRGIKTLMVPLKTEGGPHEETTAW